MDNSAQQVNTNDHILLKKLTLNKITKRTLPFCEIFRKIFKPSRLRDLATFIYELGINRKGMRFKFSQEWLATQIGCTRQTINESILILEKQGFLTILRGALGNIHTYILRVPENLKKWLLALPNFKNRAFSFGKSVSGNLTVSNKTLSSYKDYNKYRDSKEGKAANSSFKKSEIPDAWSLSHAPYMPKEAKITKDDRTAGAKALSKLKSLFKF